MKIYVCGGSSEMDIADAYMRALRGLGHEITHDWVSTIRNAGHANPRDATHRQRERWSKEDLDGIDRADVVWALLPTDTSFGCAFECGYTVGTGGTLIVSGDWKRTIFSSQAIARFNEHAHAFEWIKLDGTPGSWEDEMAALEAS